MKVASDASKEADLLLSLIPEERRGDGAILITRLFNYGIRVSPRGVQSTVRINAVRECVKNLPVHVSLKDVSTPRGYTFKALDIVSKVPSTVLFPEADDEE